MTGVDGLSVRRLGDQRADSDSSDGFGCDIAALELGEVVALGVEVALEGHVGDLDVVQPLDRGDRVPAGDDDAQREAVMRGERVAVHRIREQHRRLTGVADAEATLEAVRLSHLTRRVGAAEDQLGRA